MGQPTRAKNPKKFIALVLNLLQQDRPFSEGKEITIKQLFMLGYHPADQYIAFGAEKQTRILALEDEDRFPPPFCLCTLDGNKGVILPREFNYYRKKIEAYLATS